MQTWPVLTTDCEKCAGLCCGAYPFNDPNKFADKKAANEVCRHLAADGRCAIYEKREAKGYLGCLTFDCHGAGPRVISEVFKGSLRDQSEADVYDTFRALTRIHSALAQLKMLESLPLTPEQRDRYNQLVSRLTPSEGWSPTSLSAFPAHQAEDWVHAFAVSLADSEAGQVFIQRRERQ